MTVDEVVRDTTEFSLGIRSILEFTRAAEAYPDNGLRFSWGYYEQDLHGSVPLVSMRDGLVFLYDWWELKHPALYNDPSTPTAEIVGLIRDRTAALTTGMGEPMVMQEELLTMLGFMAMEMMDQPDKARAVFELLVEYYPQSADAHSAMAQVLEAQNDIDQALRHARDAFALSGSDEHKAQVESLVEQL
jgi:tetratricopeptide (TPR) repeat protein